MVGTAKDHHLATPKFVFALRIVQLVLAFVIIGLSAYGISILSFSAVDLTMFTAIATLIITIYVIVASTGAPAIYNYWAILALDIFAVVFWLVSFAYLAQQVSTISIVTTYTTTCTYGVDAYGFCNKKRDVNLMKRWYLLFPIAWRNTLAAAAGLGGLEFILFIITLVMTSIYLHRHRAARSHSTPGAANTANNPEAESKTEPIPLHQTQPAQPQVAYQGQLAPQQQQQYAQPATQQQYQQPIHQQQQYVQPPPGAPPQSSYAPQPAYSPPISAVSSAPTYEGQPGLEAAHHHHHHHQG